MNIKDGVLTRRHESKFGERSITLKFKEEDLDDDKWEVIKMMWQNGTGLEIDVRMFQNESGDEPEILKDKPQTLKGKGSIYQRFKFSCEELGVNYEEEKKKLGVEHLSDLEDLHTLAEIDSMLNDRLNEIKDSLNLFNPEI